MQSQDMEEIKEMFAALTERIDIMTVSVKSCQSHCYVDNPPSTGPQGRWRGLGRALMALIKL